MADKLIRGFYQNGDYHKYGDRLYTTKGSNTDGSMTQKAVTDELIVTESIALSGSGVTTVENKVISSSTYAWISSSNKTVLLISVTSGRNVHIVANANRRVMYCVMKSNSSSGNADCATGYTKPVSISAGDEKTITIPSDGKYLYIMTQYNEYDETPSVVEYVDTLKGKVESLEDDVESTEEDIAALDTRVENAETAIASSAIGSEEELYEGWGYTSGYYIKNDGSTASSSNYAYTDYIPLSSLADSDRLKVTNIVTGSNYKGGYYYNSSKTIISNKYINATSCDIAKSDMPEGAAYVRFNYSNVSPITYPTIKFVRSGNGRIDNIENRLDKLDRSQVEITSFTANTFIKSADGGTTTGSSYSSFKATDYIDLKGATAVHSSQSSLRGVGNIYGQISSSIATIAFYNSSKTFIANSSVHNKYAECPEGAAYIRCTIPASAESTIITLYGASSNSQIDTLSEAVGKASSALATGLEGKRVAFIGDSITERAGFNDAYHKVFADLMGCTNVNLGMNATTIANHPTNNMGSNRFITRATSENLSNVDMVVIFGGTNDFTYDSKPIGDLFVEETITSTGDIGSKKLVAPTDTDTFAGALHELILQVRSIIGEKPIVLMTPLNRGRYGTGKPTTREANLQGNYLMDFVDAIKEIGRFYGIPVFDSGGVMNFDPTDRNSSDYSGDLLHPNTAGHYRLGNLLYKWVCQNIFIN